MADEYIKREDAIRICKRLRDKNLENADMAFALNWAIESISRIPSADVQHIVRGQWMNKSAGNATCSNCNRRHRDVYDDDAEDAFCRSCGADMRGDETAIS